MSDQKDYYKEDLDKLKNRVDKCSLEFLDSLGFFMKEANAYMAGISDDVIKDIDDEITRFKKNCRSERRFP